MFDTFLPQLLRYPNPTDPLNPEAAAWLINEPEKFKKRIEGTLLHASMSGCQRHRVLMFLTECIKTYASEELVTKAIAAAIGSGAAVIKADGAAPTAKKSDSGEPSGEAPSGLLGGGGGGGSDTGDVAMDGDSDDDSDSLSSLSAD